MDSILKDQVSILRDQSPEKTLKELAIALTSIQIIKHLSISIITLPTVSHKMRRTMIYKTKFLAHT